MNSSHSQLFGFRFSLADAAILCGGAVTTLILLRMDHPMWWIVPMVVGHFFLFCNVFRMRRSLELLWAGAFVLDVCFWLTKMELAPLPPVLTQLPVTLAVILRELISPWYHGIFARHINVRLADYVASRLNTQPTQK
jgi:hypothetical protein